MQTIQIGSQQRKRLCARATGNDGRMTDSKGRDADMKERRRNNKPELEADKGEMREQSVDDSEILPDEDSRVHSSGRKR